MAMFCRSKRNRSERKKKKKKTHNNNTILLFITNNNETKSATLRSLARVLNRTTNTTETKNKKQKTKKKRKKKKAIHWIKNPPCFEYLDNKRLDKGNIKLEMNEIREGFSTAIVLVVVIPMRRCFEYSSTGHWLRLVAVTRAGWAVYQLARSFIRQCLRCWQSGWTDNILPNSR